MKMRTTFSENPGDMLVQAYNPAPEDAEARGRNSKTNLNDTNKVSGQPGLCNKTLSQKRGQRAGERQRLNLHLFQTKKPKSRHTTLGVPLGSSTNQTPPLTQRWAGLNRDRDPTLWTTWSWGKSELTQCVTEETIINLSLMTSDTHTSMKTLS